MKIALLGHGKMGKLCEEIALSRGHQISGIATSSSEIPILERMIQEADVLIDFSTPHCAVENILRASKFKKNIIVGTTGWYDHLPEVTKAIQQSGIGCIYSPNFSTGVALFHSVIARASQLFSKEQGYDVAALEIHHNKKLDAPSGTAKSLAATIEQKRENAPVPITSVRVGSVPGTHTIFFNSPHDSITLTHTAHSRNAWGEGAVDAAEWIEGKSGLFTFDDLLAQTTQEHLCTT